MDKDVTSSYGDDDGLVLGFYDPETSVDKASEQKAYEKFFQFYARNEANRRKKIMSQPGGSQNYLRRIRKEGLLQSQNSSDHQIPVQGIMKKIIATAAGRPIGTLTQQDQGGPGKTSTNNGIGNGLLVKL